MYTNFEKGQTSVHKSLSCTFHIHIINTQKLMKNSITIVKRELTNISSQQDEIDNNHNQVIIGGFKLYRVTPQEMPSRLHRFIVAIIWRKENQNIVGRSSGLLISSNLVLTSASSLYSPSLLRIQQKYLEVYLAPCGMLSQKYKVEKIAMPKQYQALSIKSPVKYDYALLKLQQRVKTDNFLPLEVGCYEKSAKVAIFGYPVSAYKVVDNISQKQVASQYGLILKDDAIISIRQQKSQILHIISTEPGQSGSPIILIRENEELSVIGIHKGSIKRQKNTYNFGRLITQQLINDLKIWAAKLGCEEFKSFKSTYTKEKSQLDQFIKLGDNMFTKKANEEAAEWYRKALKIDPDSSRLHCKLAACLKQSQQYPQAKEHYEMALEKDQNNWAAYSNLGNIYQQLKQLQKAIICYIKAIQINPQHSKSYYNLGIALFNSNKFEQAIKQFRKAIQIDPNYSNAYNNLGMTFQKINKIQEAIDCYRKAIMINDQDSQVYSNLGLALKEINKQQEALACFRKSLQINPNDNIASSYLTVLKLKDKYGLASLKVSRNIQVVNKTAQDSQAGLQDRMKDMKQQPSLAAKSKMKNINPSEQMKLEKKLVTVFSRAQERSKIIQGVQMQQINQEQANKSPYNNIVLIVYGRPGFRGNCTGFLINQRFVLTCAHFFLLDNPKTKMHQLADLSFCYVYPGVSGKLTKSYKIEYLAIPKLYDLTDKKTERKQLDFAIIKLMQPVSPRDPYFLLDCKYQLVQQQKQPILLYGYPEQGLQYASQTESVPDTAKQMGSTLKYRRQYFQVKLGSKNLKHYLSTLPGHGGSPLFRVIDDIPIAFAIHKGRSDKATNYKEATLITNKVLKTIQRFIKEDGMIMTTKTIHQVSNQAEIQLQIHESQRIQAEEQSQESLQNQKEGDKIMKNINPSEQMKQKIQMVTVFSRAQVKEKPDQ